MLTLCLLVVVATLGFVLIHDGQRLLGAAVVILALILLAQRVNFLPWLK